MMSGEQQKYLWQARVNLEIFNNGYQLAER
jgi:hypothetical protein